MNTDDLACVGATEGFVFSTVVTRNAVQIPDEVVQGVIRGVYHCVEWLNELGIRAEVGGGETADMTDVVRTVGLEAVAAVRVPGESPSTYSSARAPYRDSGTIQLRPGHVRAISQ